MLFGICFNFCLYGVLTAQVYSYNYNFAEDKKKFKVLVYGLFVIETAQTAMTGADAFYWYAAGFGDLARLQDTYIASLDTPFIGSFTSLIVQLFYAYRIWVIKPSLLWLSGIVGVISVTQSVGGMIDGIVGHRIHLAQVHSPLTTPSTYIWLLGEAIADLMIAASMIWLYATTRHTYSNRILAKIMRMCIETNFASATVAVIAFSLYVALPHTAYIITPTAVLGKIYSNTLLVSLNSRIMLRDSANGTRIYVHSETVVQRSQAESDHTVVLHSMSPAAGGAYKMQSLSLAERGDCIDLRATDLNEMPPEKRVFAL
ncbi:hypothetical protein FA95DRAFT_129767 [Auriscalpium vulgare]|uniref:Uncharacterized protein n=1 Tax=Auriscalpium vulgare TaxID=40419 RepID=A0ACB8RNH2_9AGAM|nr:hypothetical protein FA95DRAFT_129767 [Auriscalpium vulgare]